MQIDVDALMEGELGQWLRAQSAMRDEALERSKSRWIWSGGLAIVPMLILWFASGWSTPFLTIVCGLGVLGLGVWGYMPISEATTAIKVGINSGIAKSLGLSFSHEVTAGGEFKAARKYGLLPGYDRKTLEDRWYGELEGHRFNLYEAHLEDRRGSGKNRRWVTVFRGAVIAMELGRDFRATALLQRAGTHRKWLGFGGSKDNVTLSGHRLDLVDQVHPAFQDTFVLYSDDQVEARVLAHPSYIEHLLAVERAFEGDDLRALFHRGNVVISVKSGRLFESGAISAEGDRKRVEEAARQFGSLAGLALAINQNDRGRAMRQV
ncbi:MAG: DUF3137 domain-containing protein [Pseudomonadota bacterium]